MERFLGLHAAEHKRALERLTGSVSASVENARASDAPFHHLEFDRVFPEDTYDAMLRAMPAPSDYRRMSGRSTENDLADGTPTRVKMDLFPEYTRHLPPEKRSVWDLVGRALCSEPVKRAFMRRLAPVLERRFGPGHAGTRMYPIPILTRDIPGYRIAPHTDTHWKGITVQFYLPRDDAHAGIGTVFHEVQPGGSIRKKTQMRFVRNGGYAFVVTRDSWHSADPVGPEVSTRDSILLTYFVDTMPLRFLRNRGKRAGNFLLNEVRGGSRP